MLRRRRYRHFADATQLDVELSCVAVNGPLNVDFHTGHMTLLRPTCSRVSLGHIALECSCVCRWMLQTRRILAAAVIGVVGRKLHTHRRHIGLINIACIVSLQRTRSLFALLTVLYCTAYFPDYVGGCYVEFLRWRGSTSKELLRITHYWCVRQYHVSGVLWQYWPHAADVFLRQFWS